MFDSDEQILNFLLEEDVFSASNQHKLEQQYGDQIIQLKSNKLPKGLITLESIFNADDQARKNKTNLLVQQDHYEDLEIAKGKNLKFGKIISAEEK